MLQIIRREFGAFVSKIQSKKGVAPVPGLSHIQVVVAEDFDVNVTSTGEALDCLVVITHLLVYHTK